MNRQMFLAIAVVALLAIGAVILGLALSSKTGTPEKPDIPDAARSDETATDGGGAAPDDVEGGGTTDSGSADTGPGTGEDGGTSEGNGSDGNGSGETADTGETPAGETPLDPIDDINLIGIRGTVVDAEGDPVKSAAVSPFDFESYETGTGVPVREDGRFFIPADAGSVYYLKAHAPGYTETIEKATSPCDINIVLERGGTIRGKVVDSASREPVAEYTIFVCHMAFDFAEIISSPQSFSDIIQLILLPEELKGCAMRMVSSATGEFEIDGLAPGNYQIVVVADNYESGNANVAGLEAGGVKDGIEIALKSAGAVSGTVVDDATGMPVAGATVTPIVSLGQMIGIEYELTDRAVVTDAKGAFSIIATGEWNAAVRVWHNTYGETTARRGWGEEGDWEIRLGPGGAVIGRVFDIFKKLLPFAYVALLDNGGDGPSVKVAKADEGGNYIFEDVIPGSYMVVRMADLAAGRFSINEDDSVEVKAGETVTYDVGLSGSTVYGTVYMGGKPAAGIMVFAVPVEGETKGPIMSGTGSDGSYAIGGLKAGKYRIASGSFMSIISTITDDETDAPGEIVDVLADSIQKHDLIIEMGTVSGRIVDADSKLPLSVKPPESTGANEFGEAMFRTSALLMPVDGGEMNFFPQNMAKIGPDGTFELTMVKPGKYKLTASLPGYRVEPLEVDVAAGPLEVTLYAVQGRALLEVTVTDAATGEPISGATVNVSQTRDDDDEMGSIFWGQLGGVPLVTGADGKASGRFMAGKTEISVERDGYKDFSSDEVILIDGQTQFIPAQMAKTAPRDLTLSGIVTDSSTGGRVAGKDVEINVQCHEEEFYEQVRPDANGAYSIKVPRGEISLYINSELYKSWNGEVTAAGMAGSVVTCNIALEPGAAREVMLTGRILDAETNQPVSARWMNINVNCPEQDWHGSVNAEDGEYSIKVPRGSLDITVWAGDEYKRYDEEIEVNALPGSTVKYDIYLVKKLPRNVTLTGYVIDNETGRPIDVSSVTDYGIRTRITISAGDERITEYPDLGEGGKYSIKVPQGELAIKIRMPGYADYEDTIIVDTPAGGTCTYDIRLSRMLPADLRFRIVLIDDITGETIQPDSEEDIWIYTEKGSFETEEFSLGQGYRETKVPRTDLAFDVWIDNYVECTRHVDLTGYSGDSYTVKVRLKAPDASLKVTVVIEGTGEIFTGECNIWAEIRGTDEDAKHYIREYFNEGGEFVLAVPKGKLQVTCHAMDYKGSAEVTVDSDSAEVEVVVSKQEDE